MKKIVIIEDDIALRESLKDLLELDGYKVFAASNGVSGIQLIFNEIPNLILCDISMPGLSGYEVFKAIQNNSAVATLPFIFITAKAQKEDIQAGLQLGVDDYITKPFDYDELLATITRRLNKYENIIKQAENNFQLLLQNTLFSTLIIQDEKIVFCNPRFAKLIKQETTTLIGKNFIEYLMPEEQNILRKKFARCADNIDKNINIAIKIQNLDKQIIDVKLFAGLISYKNAPGFIVMLQENQETGNNTDSLFEYSSLHQIVEQIIEQKHELPPSLLNQLKQFIQVETDYSKQTILNSLKLTKREKEILELICKGLTNNEIADKLCLSSRTIDGHRANLLSKTNCKNTAELVVFSIKNNLF